MMDKIAKIRISLKNSEVEWEGSEEFISKYQSVIDSFIEKIATNSTSINRQTDYVGQTGSQSNSVIVSNDQLADLPNSFGEFYTSYPRSLKVVEKILVAAFFVQQKSSDGLFTIKEASDLLTEQNVLITNASAFVKSLLNTGRVFKNAGKFKVSEKGIEFVKQFASLA